MKEFPVGSIWRANYLDGKIEALVMVNSVMNSSPYIRCKVMVLYRCESALETYVGDIFPFSRHELFACKDPNDILKDIL